MCLSGRSGKLKIRIKTSSCTEDVHFLRHTKFVSQESNHFLGDCWIANTYSYLENKFKKLNTFA